MVKLTGNDWLPIKSAWGQPRSVARAFKGLTEIQTPLGSQTIQFVEGSLGNPRPAAGILAGMEDHKSKHGLAFSKTEDWILLVTWNEHDMKNTLRSY